MIAATALGDVMQQGGAIKRPAGLQILHQAGRDRRHLRQLSPLELVQHPQRLDRVLIDREHMIGVELHLAHDPRPVRQIAAEEPALVQDRNPAGPLRAGVLTILAAEQVEEDDRRRRVVTQQDGLPLVPDQRTQRQRMQVQGPVARNLEDAQHQDGTGLEINAWRTKQLAVRQHKALVRQRRIGFSLERRGTQSGAHDGRLQHGGDARDLPRRQEIMAHEPLNAILPAVPGVAHAGTDDGLQVERQPVLCPARHVMQVEPHGP